MKKFEGKPVTDAGIEVPGLAGGLRDAMKVAPVELGQGETAFVLVEAVVNKVRHDPIDSDDPHGSQRRVHILRAETATLVSEAEGTRLLSAHKEALRKAREIDGQGDLLEDDESDEDARLREAGENL